MCIHDVFHVELLMPYKEDSFGCFEALPPPIITEEGEEEYKVEKIVAWEWHKGKLYYQVRWKGYDSLEDTMEHAEKIGELD